jgi:hypothetical protein
MSAKTSVSKAAGYVEIGAFWDEHDATEFGNDEETHFDVNIQSQRMYFALDNALSPQIRQIAEQHGVSPETLLNLWVQEKINQVQQKV